MIIGVIKKLLRYKRPAAVAVVSILFFAYTIALFAAPTPPGTPIINIASVEYKDTNQNPYDKETLPVTTITTERTQGVIEFFNENWEPKSVYKVGETLYIQVTDLDQNNYRDLQETVTITLTDSQTGDTETITLYETGIDTGIFRGSIPTTSAPPVPNNDILSVRENTIIKAIYTDPLDPQPVVESVAYIDPYGIVFDSITGNPIEGVVVTLIDASTGVAADLPFDPNPVTTDPDGKFAFPLVPPGTYYFSLSSLPEGYTYPSVVPTLEMPSGYEIVNGSRGESFELTPLTPPLNIDIPIDPKASEFSITKTANRTTASIGDIIRYSVKISNQGNVNITNISVTDVMPHGISYVEGTTKFDSLPTFDPTITGRTLVWEIPIINSNTSIEITYNAIISVGTKKGDAKNRVIATGTSVGKSISSPPVSFTIKINEGVFTSKGTIIGKVFLDNNRNKIQDTDESGIKGVVLYTQDGTRVVTDEQGKYSIPGVTPGTHIIRIDETTIPDGLKPYPISNRFMGNNISQFADILPSGLFRADFALIEEDISKEETPTTINTIQIASFQKRDTKSAILTAQKLEKEGFNNIRVELIQDKLTLRMGNYNSTADAQVDLKKIKKYYSSAFIRRAYILPDRVVYPDVSQKSNDTVVERVVETPIAPQTQEEKLELLKEDILNMVPELNFISPLDETYLPKKSTNVMFKAPLNTTVTLYLNGTKVEEKKLGMKLESNRSRTTVYEYIGLQLKQGAINIFKIEIVDQFGNVRGVKEVTVTTPDNPFEIVVNPKEKKIQADGISILEVEAFIKDKNGNILEYPTSFTIETSVGEILTKDIDKSAQGLQVSCNKGVAKFQILSPISPSLSTIKVYYDNLVGENTVFFSPYLRPLMLIGYGEVALGYSRTKGNTSYLDKNWMKEEGLGVSGRGALFAKGDIGNGFLLTASFDTAKERDDDFFHERVKNTETEDKYPIYGDDSKLEYEAQSKDKMYIRVDKDESHIMYGDIQTGFNDSKLNSYERTFTGLKSEIKKGDFSFKSFLSHTNQVQKIDTFPAKGISGYYYLTSRSVIEGSDMVIIETRDRNRPEKILTKDRMRRGNDYVIDYDIGGILFKRAIPSHDSNLNPIFITVSYETEGTGKKYYITGARISTTLFPWLKIGITGVKEDQELQDKTLLGADLTLSLPGNTTVKTEFSQTESIFDVSNTFTPKKDTGWLIEVDSHPTDNLLLSAYYRNIGDYFDNPSAIDVMRGTEKYGFEAILKADETTWLKATYFDEKDTLNDMKHQFGSIGVGKKIGKTTLEAEFYRETATDNYVSPSSPSSREPFDFSEDTPEEATGAKVRIEQQLNSKVSISLEHKQNFLADEGTVTRAGIDYKIDKTRKAYLRQEYGHFEDRKEMRTALGVEADLTPSTSAFNEYRLSGGIDGNNSQQSIGLRNKFNLADNITGNVSVENLTTLSGKERQSQPDAFAAALGLEYLPKDDLKITSRFEHRRQTSERSNLAELSIATMLNPEYSFMFRQRLFYNSFIGGGEQITSRTLFGSAYRPIMNNKFNALARLEFKVDKNTNSSPSYNETSYIGSVEGNYQFNSKTQFTGKYAGKLTNDADISSYSDLISGRLLHDITDRFDLGLELRLLNSYDIGTSFIGGSAEIGYRVVKDLWFSLGYSFDSFDQDLTGSTYSGKGPYIMLRFKLDENLFK